MILQSVQAWVVAAVLFFGWVSPCRADSLAELKSPILSTATKEELRELQSLMGRILPMDQAPQLYELVTLTFRRMAQTQEAKLQDHYVPINYIFIIDSPFVNAFVHSPKQEGVRIAKNLVFVTTAMLRKLIDLDPERLKQRYPDLDSHQQKAKEIETGLERLAGVLAHELAHPLDQLVSYGRHEASLSIEKEYGDRGAQALELRADIEGTLLARDSDLPDNVILDAQERILDDSLEVGSFRSMTSSHPENSLRKTAMRMFLTVMRLREGHLTEVRPILTSTADIDKVERDLNAVRIGRGPMPWNEPKDISSAISRLKAVSSLRPDFQPLEYNRLLLYLDHLFKKAEDSAEGSLAEYRTQFADTMRFIIRRSLNHPVWSNSDRRKALTPYEDSHSLLELPTHFAFIKTLNVYKSPEYVRAVTSYVDSQMSIPAERRLELLVRVSDFLPPDIFLSLYGQELVALEMAMIFDSRPYESPISEIKSPALILGLNSILQEHYGANMTGADRLAYVFAAGQKKMPFPFFLMSGAKSMDDGFVVSSRRFAALVRKTRQMAQAGDPEAKVHFTALYEHARWFWNFRHDFAQAELMMSGSPYSGVLINWRLIAEVLGMSYEGVLHAVAEAFLDSLSQPNLAELGRIVKSSPLSSVQKLRSLNVVHSALYEKSKMPEWFRTDLGERVLGMRMRLSAGDEDYALGLMVLTKSVLCQGNSLEQAYRHTAMSYFMLQKNEPWTAANVLQRLSALDELFEKHYWYVHRGYGDDDRQPASLVALAQAVDESTVLKLADKNLILRALFLRDPEIDEELSEQVNPDFYNWISLPQENVDTIYGILVKSGVVKSVPEFATKLKASPHFKPMRDLRLSIGNAAENTSGLSVYFEFIDRLSHRVLEDIHRLPSDWRLIQDFVSLLNTPYPLHVDRGSSNTPRIQDVRNALAQKATEIARQVSLREKIRFFLDLTGTGNSVGSDKFFEQQIAPELFSSSSPKYQNWIKGILLTNRIQSHDLALQLTIKSLAPRVVAMAQSGAPSRDELYSLISDLNLMAPSGSLRRDEYLEQIAWDLGLRGSNLYAFIEDQKSANWKRENPMLVNSGSAIASGIYKMSYARRLEFLIYLMNPNAVSTGLPQDVADEFVDQGIKEGLDHLTAATGSINPDVRSQIERAAKAQALELKLTVESYLRDAAPTERIPLIELVITAGPTSLMAHQNFPFNLSREFLGYPKGSVEEQMLLSYLAVVPSHEVAPSLAYLLSQAKDDKRTVASLFELFGTVGVKFGQLASIWKMFGEQVANETRHLKDRAPAMTKQEILDQMRELLSPELREQIELEKILGSASVKTVVKIKLPSGQRAVMAMQRSTVESQVAMNLNMGQRFLEELGRREMVRHSRTLASLIKSLKTQLSEEIDFNLEAERSLQAGQILTEISNGSGFGGWKFNVPKLVEGLPLKKEVAFYDLVEGVPYDSLTPEQKAEVGPLMVKASLAMLFRYGRFDADRHKGNWLIDFNHRTIHAIDFGQLETFVGDVGQDDPRNIIIDLFRGVFVKNPRAVYEQLRVMSESPAGIPDFDQMLALKLIHALEKNNLSDQLVEIFKVATEQGFQIQRRYSFGALKGFLIIYGEGYVSSPEFGRILVAEVAHLKTQKFTSKVSGLCEHLLGRAN